MRRTSAKRGSRRCAMRRTPAKRGMRGTCSTPQWMRNGCGGAADKRPHSAAHATYTYAGRAGR
eukprot:7859893-Pyramimonas_sp.AAC.1